MNNSTVNFTTPETSTNSNFFGSLYILQMCLHSINFLFFLPTHSYVIWLIITGTGSGFAFEFIFLNLSVSEIGSCLNSMISLLSLWFSDLLTVQLFFVGLIITGRPLFHCLICVERYLAVLHPVTFLKYKPLRYRVICCTVAWIIILGSCMCCMFTMVSHRTGYMWFLLLQFLLFFSIQFFCLVAVMRALRLSGPKERGRKRKKENDKMRKVIYLILISTATIVIIYVPVTFSALFTIVTNKYINDIWFPAVFCYVMAGFVQPVLYLSQTGKLSCLCSL